MDNKHVKLMCPMCGKIFVTNYRQQIWCNKLCSEKYHKIGVKINNNIDKQLKMDSELYNYNLDKDTFYINLKK